MAKNILKLIIILISTVALGHSAAADTITLKSGQVHKGVITAEEAGRVQIKLESSGVRLWFSRDQILDYEVLNPKKPKDKEETKPEPADAESSSLDDDVARAQALLEKIRAEQPNNPKLKNKTRKSGATKKKTEENESKPKVELVTYSDEEVDALIAQLRHAPSIYDRRNACIELGNTGAMQAIPHLIHVLDDETTMMRKAGNESLKKITGEDFGFNPSERSRSVRLEAIERWNKWYKELKDEKARKTLRSWF
jgi:hypothetical protein